MALRVEASGVLSVFLWGIVRLWLALSLGLLMAADVQSCEMELGKVLQRFLTILPNDTDSKMAFYSGKWIGDLGNYFDCIEMAQADYALFSLQIDGTSLYYSLCGPANCTVRTTMCSYCLAMCNLHRYNNFHRNFATPDSGW